MKVSAISASGGGVLYPPLPAEPSASIKLTIEHAVSNKTTGVQHQLLTGEVSVGGQGGDQWIAVGQRALCQNGATAELRVRAGLHIATVVLEEILQLIVHIHGGFHFLLNGKRARAGLEAAGFVAHFACSRVQCTIVTQHNAFPNFVI